MRVLYLHQYFVPPGGSGGTRSYEFARRLVARGHRVTMITSDVYLPAEYRGRPSFVLDGIEVVALPVPYSNEFGYRRRIQAFLSFAARASFEVLRREADVVFASSTPLTIAVPALVAHWTRRRPMVFEVRDLWPELPVAVGALRNPAAVAAARWLARTAYRSAREIVALSPGMKEDIVGYGIPPSKIEVIPNACDRALFDVPESAGDEVRCRLGLEPGQPLVTYTGTFGLINGLSYAVEMAAALKHRGSDVHVLLVGTGAERPKIEALARERGTYGVNVTIWDPVPKVRMPSVYAASAAGLSLFRPIPEMRNNSANKFFDCLAAGRPAVINYGGWQADILRAEGAGIVLPEEDPHVGAEMLDEFVHDTERLASARRAARKIATQMFDRDLLANRLSRVLHRAVEPERVESAMPTDHRPTGTA